MRAYNREKGAIKKWKARLVEGAMERLNQIQGGESIVEYERNVRIPIPMRYRFGQAPKGIFNLDLVAMQIGHRLNPNTELIGRSLPTHIHRTQGVPARQGSTTAR